MFKFNPLIFSPVSWIKKTVGSSFSNCGHLGLIFGKTENLLYAFSWYNGLSTVSLLDSDGNSIWQYSTPDGDSLFSNTINYKEIDSANDMVIATSGYNNIIYNRIFHSSSSPYSVDTTRSKSYKDPTI